MTLLSLWHFFAIRLSRIIILKTTVLLNLICKNSYDHSKSHLTRMWENAHKNISDRLFTNEHFEVHSLQDLQLI